MDYSQLEYNCFCQQHKFKRCYSIDSTTVFEYDPVISKSPGERKWFELAGVRLNEVKISSKALQGELILLRISGATSNY